MRRSIKGSIRPKRLFLPAVLAVVAVVGAACGSSSSTAAKTSSGGAKTLQNVTLALDWTPNTNHTGFFVAKTLGYYKAAGINLKIIPYNTATPDTLVGAGKANFGISFQDQATFDYAAKVPVTSVMAILQHTATVIAVKADRTDIKSPKNLDGKVYGGFGAPYEVPTLQTVIRNAGGTGKFKTIVLNTESYTALYHNQVDFTIPFVAWEVIEAKLLHEPLKTWKYSDYGFPDFYQVVMIGNNGFLASHSDLARRFVQATQKGFSYAAHNPSAAAKILIDDNPGVFTLPKLVYLSAALLAKSYYLDAQGRFGYMTLKEWTGYSSFLFKKGILLDSQGHKVTTAPDYAKLFTNSYLAK